MRTLLPLLVLAATLVTLPACSTNPATGRLQLVAMSEEKEIALGKQEAPNVEAQFGVYRNDELQDWFSGACTKIAGKTEDNNYPFTFTLLDSPVVNALALPGGPTYATRGLLAHANSEAEVAGVMGHEIGHVVARHGAERLAKQRIVGGLALGAGILSGNQQIMNLAGTAGQLLMLRYSRSNETEADELGVRYMARAGYDPREMSDFMKVLDRLSKRSSNPLPAWLSTHPDPGGRAERTRELARPLVKKAKEKGKTLIVRQDEYYALLPGLVFGDDPRAGFVKGNTFHHPEMRFRYDLPEGWLTQNSPAFVVHADSAEQTSAVMQLSLVGGEDAELGAAGLAKKVGEEQGITLSGSNTTLNGLPAWVGSVSIQSGQGGSARTLLAAWIEHDDKLFQLIGQWASAVAEEKRPQIERAMRSFRVEKDSSVLGVKPVTLDLVTLEAGRTLQSLCDRREDLGATCTQIADINQTSRDKTKERSRTIKIPLRRHPLWPISEEPVVARPLESRGEQVEHVAAHRH